MKPRCFVAAVLFLGTLASAQQTPAPAVKFEVVSISPVQVSDEEDAYSRMTPNGYLAQSIVPQMLLRIAYNMMNADSERFLNLPEWATHERFNIQAKVSDEDAPAFQRLSIQEKRAMLQALLRERFHLEAHEVEKEGHVYFLLPSKGGPKMEPSTAKEGTVPTLQNSPGHISARNADMKNLTMNLTQILQITVLDKTGLEGRYNCDLKWAPGKSTSETADTPAEGISIFTAVQEQLGLKLEYTKASIMMLSVDRMERPTGN